MKYLFKILCFILILLPLFRVAGVMELQTGDFTRHEAKIREMYLDELLLVNASVMTTYPSLIHKVLWYLSGKNMDNVLFVYSLLLCIFIMLFRLILYLFVNKRFSIMTTFFILYLYLELPYKLPSIVASIVNRPLLEFPIGFWSLELNMLYGGLLPFLISLVVSLIGLLSVWAFPFAFLIALSISKFSGFIAFMCVFFVNLLICSNLKLKKVLLGLFLMFICAFNLRTFRAIIYVVDTGLIRNDRLFVFVVFFVFLVLVDVLRTKKCL